jgi:MFS family permease
MLRRSDLRRILAACLLRSVSTGMAGVLLGVALPAYDLRGGEMGVIVSLGLGGTALYMLLATLGADRFGRRRSLTVLCLLGAAGGTAFALGGVVPLLAGAALVGAVNGMGRDRGAALVIEHAILPGIVPESERTRAFVWYNVVQDAGHALGALAAGLPSLLVGHAGLAPVDAYRAAFGLYAALTALPLLLYAGLSPAAEAPAGEHTRPVSPQARRVVWRISALFGFDSLAGGFLTAALVSYFFQKEFGVGEEALAPLFFAARVLNAVSHVGAGWLARRIGLLPTMVFTHIPSSVLLMTLTVTSSFEWAAVLFLLREGLVEMDVPTRQSYVMALVGPEERTFASGVTNLVRTSAWAVAPAFAGRLMESVALGVPLLIGGGMKIAYDVALWMSFRKVRPPEERQGP